MQHEELITTVKNVISQGIEIPVDHIELSTKLAELGIDSLDVLKLALIIEKSFEIKISTNELLQIETVGDIVAGIESKVVN